VGADLNTDDAALLEDVGEADAVIYGSALINGRLPESEKRRIATRSTANGAVIPSSTGARTKRLRQPIDNRME